MSQHGILVGYDLRITRALDWTANAGCEISAAEWRQLVAGDADLSPDPEHGPLAVRFGPSRWFDWYEGNIYTTDPDRVTVAKMLDLARQLTAAVQGDDGEFYDSPSQWRRAIREAGR